MTSTAFATPIILHRSLGSPYSEKAMLALSYLGIRYQSVIAPKGVPRPIQEKLVGAYSRRIPVLQIGADIICDTDLMIRHLAHLAGRHDLLINSDEAQELTDWLNRDLEPAMIRSLSKSDFILGYFRNIPFRDAIAFLRDRSKLAKQFPPSANPPSRETFRKRARAGLEKLNQRLVDQPYMMGDRITAVDFTAYTMIRYHMTLNRLKLGRHCPHLLAWYERIHGIGFGEFEELAPPESLHVARQHMPLEIETSFAGAAEIGMADAFRPDDLLGSIMQPVCGRIVGGDRHRLILRPDHETPGPLHIHYPRRWSSQ